MENPMDNKIVPTPGNSKISVQSSTDSLETAGKWLIVTASIMGKDLTEAEALVWKKLLAPYPAAKIDHAFRKHVENEVFFPKPAEILGLIREEMRNEQPTVGEIYRRQLAEPSRFDAENEDKK